MEGTVKEFYKNKKLFLTGGTGFVGHLVVQKLLEHTQLSEIYFLIRSKKGVTPGERLKKIFSDPLFHSVREKQPDFSKRVIAVEGDCSLPNLGLSSEDRKLIVQNADIVIHSAASIKFLHPLSVAMKINTVGTQNVINLCKEMKHLNVFIHVSSAFTNSNQSYIEERVYRPSEEHFELLEKMDCNYLDANEKQIIGDFPNTYIYTKNLTEALVERTAGEIPTAIFRPALIGASNENGWTNNMNGTTGCIYLFAVGIWHVLPVKEGITASVVPVDMVASGIIAAAWQTVNMWKSNQKKLLVYNYSPQASNSITYAKLIKTQLAIIKQMPLKRCAWYYDFMLVESMLLFKFLSFFYHTIPGYISDLWFTLIGARLRLTPIFNLANKVVTSVNVFYYNEFEWDTKNVGTLWQKLDDSDKKWLYFDMATLDWKQYAVTCYKGIRTFLAKENDSMIPVGIKRQKFFYKLHLFTRFLIYLSLWYTLLWLYKIFV